MPPVRWADPAVICTMTGPGHKLKAPLDVYLPDLIHDNRSREASWPICICSSVGTRLRRSPIRYANLMGLTTESELCCWPFSPLRGGGVDRSGKRGPTVALAGILVQEQQPGGEAPESGAGEQTELGDLLDQLLHAYTPENDFGSLYGTKIFYKISPGQGGGS